MKRKYSILGWILLILICLYQGMVKIKNYLRRLFRRLYVLKVRKLLGRGCTILYSRVLFYWINQVSQMFGSTVSEWTHGEEKCPNLWVMVLMLILYLNVAQGGGQVHGKLRVMMVNRYILKPIK